MASTKPPTWALWLFQWLYIHPLYIFDSCATIYWRVYPRCRNSAVNIFQNFQLISDSGVWWSTTLLHHRHHPHCHPHHHRRYHHHHLHQEEEEGEEDFFLSVRALVSVFPLFFLCFFSSPPSFHLQYFILQYFFQPISCMHMKKVWQGLVK